MKMVKSLLLGAAAGLVAVAGAQAADLPVKAKPVQYVKICSLYGAGFYYIPGTDTCIKVGGWIRAEYAFHTGNSDYPFVNGAGGRENFLDSNDYAVRARYVLSADVRAQTAYGTLRGYIRAGFQKTTGEGHGRVYQERGFIQLAGFTLGQTQSFYDGFNGSYSYGNGYVGAGSQYGANGTDVAAYTLQLGNGLSTTISVEDPWMRRTAIWDAGTAGDALALAAIPAGNGGTGNQTLQDSYNAAALNTGDYAASHIPDIVWNLRVDQAWGSAQVMAAYHQLTAGCFGTCAVPTGAGTGSPGTKPSDKTGFAIGAGVKINLPMLGRGDSMYVEAHYADGATGYTHNSALGGATSNYGRFEGMNTAQGWAFDAVFGTNATNTVSIGLSTVRSWTIGAGIEHYWMPNLRTSLYGNYFKADFSNDATLAFCSSPNSPVRTLAGVAPAAATFGTAAGALPGCDPDFAVWNFGTRTIWNPVANLDVGLEFMYSRIDQNMNAASITYAYAGNGGRPAGLYSPADLGTWSSILRVQYNFWP